jgi:hypothetical protein
MTMAERHSSIDHLVRFRLTWSAFGCRRPHRLNQREELPICGPFSSDPGATVHITKEDYRAIAERSLG